MLSKLLAVVYLFWFKLARVLMGWSVHVIGGALPTMEIRSSTCSVRILVAKISRFLSIIHVLLVNVLWSLLHDMHFFSYNIRLLWNYPSWKLFRDVLKL